jgi:1-acyl-sn-glycerol-3-phosphate acyltransferase
VNIAEITWGIGRMTLVPATYVVTRLQHYGKDRVPDWGGVVLAMNHFSWIDVAAFGSASPRTIYYVAKEEAHRVPALGQIIRGFGTLSVRRGESDREAVRLMRQTVRDGRALGVFVEGTRQKSGVPGEVQAGAAMVAINEGVPVVPGAIHGTQDWRVGNFHPASIAWGEPMRFDGLARNGRGYREGSEQIKVKIYELWEWLVELHEAGRPRIATPPR